VLDGDPVFHLLAQLGLQLGGGVGRFAFDALLLFGFEAGFAFGFGFDFVGGAREFFARAFGGLGGDVGVDAGAREHVAAAVGGGFRSEERRVGREDGRAGVAFGDGQRRERERGVAGVLDGDPVFHLLAQLGLQLGGGVGRFAFDALFLFGFEGGSAFYFGFSLVVCASDLFARAFGGLGGDVGVDAGAREHVAAAVGGGFAGRDRALAGADERAGVAFGVAQRLERERGVAGVLDGDPVFHLLAQLAGQFGGGVGGFAFKALLLFDFKRRFGRDFDFHRRRFVGDRRFARRRGTDG